MKVIGIIGYKGRGKTALLIELAQELASRAHRVATVKHSPDGIDISDKDTEKHKKVVSSVAAISDKESVLFLPGKHSLEDMLKYIQADYVIVEGFKQERTYPKILCVQDKEEIDNLADGLEVAAVGNVSHLAIPVISDIRKLCDLVEQKAFKLPKLDCGACGFTTCYQLAKEIVQGKKDISDCPALSPEIKIRIDEKLLALNPFTSELIRNTVAGLLSSLKGYKPRRVEIEIEGK